eukprot:scaffold24176_cov49-Phaeocystis_antarctica.AAC.2
MGGDRHPRPRAEIARVRECAEVGGSRRVAGGAPTGPVCPSRRGPWTQGPPVVGRTVGLRVLCGAEPARRVVRRSTPLLRYARRKSLASGTPTLGLYQPIGRSAPLPHTSYHLPEAELN